MDWDKQTKIEYLEIMKIYLEASRKFDLSLEKGKYLEKIGNFSKYYN